MSQENVEIVRLFNAPVEGDDAIPDIREMLERTGPDFEPDTVLADWAKHPVWRHAHHDIEWDGSALGIVKPALGPREVMLFWADWSEAWESYVYRIVEYRDLGDHVLTPLDIHAHGPGGIPVEMRIFQTWEVRDGKIWRSRSFPSEQEALEAVGLSE
jgi:hypothetical protein